MNDTRFSKPQLRFDGRGRVIPMTPAERQADLEAMRAMLAEIRSIPEEPGEVDIAEVFRAIDSHRPERPLFEEYY